MKRIEDTEFCSVEHYISQRWHQNSNHDKTYHRNQQLKYNNMIAVCKNNGQHCDKSRGNIPLQILNPHSKTCEQLIKYTINGKIESYGNDNVEFDIDLLQLNCQLVWDTREEFWQYAKNELIKKHPKGTWNRKILESEMQNYIDKYSDKFKPYCNYIIFQFIRLMALPKYNN